MTIKEAINKADSLKPNQYSDDLKLMWLADLDHRIYIDLITTHENNPFFTEPEYDEEENLILVNEEGQKFKSFPYEDDSEELIAERPYTDLYVYYIFAKIDESNGDTEQYINSTLLYNNAYSDYAKAYNRKNRHL